MEAKVRGRIVLCLVVLGCQDAGKSEDGGTGGSGTVDAAAGSLADAAVDAAIGTGGGPADSGPADSGTGGSGGTGGGGGGAGGTVNCGTATCKLDSEYCRIKYPGTGGTVGYSCPPRNGCNSCDCIPAEPLCRCSQSSSGSISVTCGGI
jgi:hypothetical protein